MTRRGRAGEGAAAWDRARLQVLAGVPVAVGSATPPRLARAVALASAVGAPLQGVVDAASSAADDRADIDRAIEVAVAQPRLVAGLLLALPLLLAGIVSGATGATPLQLLHSAPGRLVLGVALGLQVVGGCVIVLLVRRVHRAAADDAPTADEVVDLVVAALLAGRPTGAALRDVATVAPRWADHLRQAALSLERGGAGVPNQRPAPVDALVALLGQADQHGASAVGPLRDLAARLRRDDRGRALARAERLPVLLAVPTALFLLPATVLLVGAPLLLRMVQP